MVGHQRHPAGLSPLHDPGNVLTTSWNWEVDALREQVSMATVALPPVLVAVEAGSESDEARQGTGST